MRGASIKSRLGDSVAAGDKNQLKILELSELAGGLAHEIRNPLSTLKVNLQLLSEDLQEEPDGPYVDPDLRRRVLRRLGTLRVEADRLQLLLDDFLKLVGQSEINTQPTDLNEIVKHLAEFFSPKARELSVELRVALSSEPLICNLDSSLIGQALLNLCLNAQQAMPEGGELIVETSAQGKWAQIDVTDTGIGVQPEIANSLFKPFFSTKKEGSGLGLSLTRRIVMEHGGSIDFQSQPGRGSRFTVRIPLAHTV